MFCLFFCSVILYVSIIFYYYSHSYYSYCSYHCYCYYITIGLGLTATTAPQAQQLCLSTLADVLAAASGLFSAGSAEVQIREGHNSSMYGMA